MAGRRVRSGNAIAPQRSKLALIQKLVRRRNLAAHPRHKDGAASSGAKGGKGVNLIDLAFGVADVTVGSTEISTGLVEMTIESIMTENVNPLAVAKTTLGVATLNDGVNGIMTAFDGKERPPTLQVWGGNLMGPVGAAAGLAASQATTAQGWRSLARGGPKGVKEVVELMQAEKQYGEALNGK